MSKVVRATIGLMIVTILSKILGLIRDITLASVYGASSYSDVYLISLVIPNVIFTGIGSSIKTTYIPIYYKVLESKGKKECIKFTNYLINITIIMCLIISLLAFLRINFIVKLIAVGFKGDTLNLAINFTKISIWGIIFIGLSFISMGFLQANNNFIIPGLIGIPFNIIIISSIFFSQKTNINILAYGTLLAWVSQFIFQIPFLYKKGFRYKPILNLNDKNIKKLLCLVMPIFMGVSVNQLNTLIDRSLASTLVEGSISALNYANKLNSFVIGMFVLTIITVIYPLLSKQSINNKDQFKISIVKSISIIILIVMPISVGAGVLSNPIVKVLFKRGSFDITATKLTSEALFYYSIGIVGVGLKEILQNVFYSLHDTKTPMINSTISVVINIILNFILIKYMAHAGLALATSISSIVTAVLLFIKLKRKIGSFGERKIYIVFIKSTISAIIMGVVVKNLYNYFTSIISLKGFSEILNLGLSVFVGVIVYSMFLIILRVKEVTLIFDLIKKEKYI